MPYQRSKETAAGDVEGYGLGLAITKAAIDFHRGKLRYKNMKPRGREVRVYLPLPIANV